MVQPARLNSSDDYAFSYMNDEVMRRMPDELNINGYNLFDLQTEV